MYYSARMRLRKLAASLCVAALVVGSPGLGCYEAFAQSIGVVRTAPVGTGALGQVGTVGAALSQAGAGTLSGGSLFRSGSSLQPTLPSSVLPTFRPGSELNLPRLSGPVAAVSPTAAAQASAISAKKAPLAVVRSGLTKFVGAITPGKDAPASGFFCGTG